MKRKINKLLKKIGADTRYMYIEITTGIVGGIPINCCEDGSWNSYFIDWNGGRNFLNNGYRDPWSKKGTDKPLKLQNGDELNFYITWKSEEISDKRGDGNLLFALPTIEIINEKPVLTCSY
jgi:hypothetical protein